MGVELGVEGGGGGLIGVERKWLGSDQGLEWVAVWGGQVVLVVVRWFGVKI